MALAQLEQTRTLERPSVLDNYALDIGSNLRLLRARRGNIGGRAYNRTTTADVHEDVETLPAQRNGQKGRCATMTKLKTGAPRLRSSTVMVTPLRVRKRSIQHRDEEDEDEDVERSALEKLIDSLTEDYTPGANFTTS
ncbi:hypothetical protein HDU87_001672 [Geranomyces variabilis]|uniref:Uncharacterized protein n=1 Tax=Geranomyces variabilis TaxID=109894 RepID=A0AAD5TC91_9FUNG|nr:hypothetical protein HDU87_001672 [Geranomyces variabilis]